MKMIRTREDIEKALNRLLDKAVAIARADGIITDEEKEILDQLKLSVRDLDPGTYEILDNDLSEVEFRDLLDQLQKQIFENLLQKLKKRSKPLTADQQRLIDLLMEKGLLQNLSG